MVTIRIWLRSVSRVGQPPRDSAPPPPVSGVAASPVANRRILASFRHPGKALSVSRRLSPGELLSGSKTPPCTSMLTVLHGEVLYFQPPAHQERKLLHPTVRVTHLAQKPLQMRHPIFGQLPQPIEKKELIASRMTTPHTRHRCVARVGRFPSGEAAPPQTVNHPCSPNRNQNLILLKP